MGRGSVQQQMEVLMKVGTITGICACLAGCALSAGEDGNQASEQSDAATSAVADANADLTVGKFSKPSNAINSAAAVQNGVRAFAHDEASEVVTVHSRFDATRVQKVELFRDRLGVQQ
jgi:hypothetical protein